MIKFDTTVSFINDHVRASGYTAGDLISTEGYTTKGDLGGGVWRALGTTGTVSQDPLTNNSPDLSDASGNEFTLVAEGVIDLNVLGGTGVAYSNIADAAGFTYSQGLTSNPNVQDRYITADESGMVNRASPQVDEAYIVSDRGDGIFDTVTVGTTPNVDLPNGFNIIVSIADPTKCFVLRINPIVYIEQIGVSGDGVTDDSAAINYATQNFDNVKTDNDKDYYCSSTPIVVPKEHSFEIGNNSRLVSDITTGDLIKVEGDSAGDSWTKRHRKIKISVARDAIEWDGIDTASRGIVLENLGAESDVYVASENFRFPLVLRADADGFAYNTIHFGTIRNGLENVLFEDVSAGFVNQNTFIGGRVRHDSSIPTSVGTIGLNIDSGNNNQFLGTALEGGNTETTINILDGVFNGFYNVRYEDINDASIVLGASSARNLFVGGYDLKKVLFNDTGIGNSFLSGHGSILKSSGAAADKSAALELHSDSENALEVYNSGDTDLSMFIDADGNASWNEEPAGANAAIQINGPERRIKMGNGAAGALNNIFRGATGGADLEGQITATGSGFFSPVEDTAANIADIAASINTTDKVDKKMVWDTTNNRLLRSDGAAANSVWYVVDGSVTITPS